MPSQKGSNDAIRLAAFRWLEAQVNIHGEVLPRALLAKGFDFAGEKELPEKMFERFRRAG